MPSILEGYCEKSDKPREEAENEAKVFLQIIEDASSYMFGKIVASVSINSVN
jgi:DNA polymerase-3 subunit alpha